MTHYKHFKHLHVPDHWQQYYTKYPEGYTILEALIEWVSQVDKMVDNVNDWNDYLKEFVENFDNELQTSVTNILTDWHESGFLKIVIDEAIEFKYDMLERDVYSRVINVKNYGAVGDGITDDTNAFKQAIAKSIETDVPVIVPETKNSYLITNTVYSGESNPRIEGVSSHVKITFMPTGENTPLFHLYGAGGERVEINNFIIEGDTENPFRRGVFLKVDGALRYSDFKNLQFSYINKCFELLGDVYSNSFTRVRSIAVEYHLYIPNPDNQRGFNNVSFHDCNYRATTYGIYCLSLCNGVTFYDCVFDIRDRSNLDGNGGIYFTKPRNLNFIGGYVEARNKSVFHFELEESSSYSYLVSLKGLYIRNNISGTGVRNSTGIKVVGNIDLKLEGNYFNGWLDSVDYTEGTGTIYDDDNSFANITNRILTGSNSEYLNKYRGVVDYGSNENGRYIRFHDGTQICYHVLTSSSEEITTWEFPATFITSPIPNATPGWSGNEMISCAITSRTDSDIGVRVWRINESTGLPEQVGTSIYLSAQGRWK